MGSVHCTAPGASSQLAAASPLIFLKYIRDISMEYVQPAVETLKPYDLSASKLIKGFGLAGTIGALLLGFVLVLAIKLRLLSKIGYYLGSVGICFLALGTTLLFNTPLLIIGNAFVLAGLVFVIGFERTRLYDDIFRDNLSEGGRALAWAGFVIVVSGLLAELITKMPVVNRLYKWVPWIKEIVEASDKELVTLTSDEPEVVPWTTPGRLRSRGKKE